MNLPNLNLINAADKFVFKQQIDEGYCGAEGWVVDGARVDPFIAYYNTPDNYEVVVTVDKYGLFVDAVAFENDKSIGAHFTTNDARELTYNQAQLLLAGVSNLPIITVLSGVFNDPVGYTAERHDW